MSALLRQKDWLESINEPDTTANSGEEHSTHIPTHKAPSNKELLTPIKQSNSFPPPTVLLFDWLR